MPVCQLGSHRGEYPFVNGTELSLPARLFEGQQAAAVAAMRCRPNARSCPSMTFLRGELRLEPGTLAAPAASRRTAGAPGHGACSRPAREAGAVGTPQAAGTGRRAADDCAAMINQSGFYPIGGVPSDARLLRGSFGVR
jgi:hypothetical protein